MVEAVVEFGSAQRGVCHRQWFQPSAWQKFERLRARMVTQPHVFSANSRIVNAHGKRVDSRGK
jgi:hypothetical protein